MLDEQNGLYTGGAKEGMTRRSFLGAAGLFSLAGAMPAAAGMLAPEASSLSRPLSTAARRGWLPNVPLVAHTGETFNFYDDLVRGDRIVLLNFFVVACQDGRCPAVNQTLRKVQDMVGSRMGKDVFFYSVTLEPERDTVPILKEYAEDIFEVKPGWLFLTGKQADIDLLRRRQGFVDPDPERDRNPALHSSTGRVIADRQDRWAMVPLMSSAPNIFATLRTI